VTPETWAALAVAAIAATGGILQVVLTRRKPAIDRDATAVLTAGATVEMALKVAQEARAQAAHTAAELEAVKSQLAGIRAGLTRLGGALRKLASSWSEDAMAAQAAGLSAEAQLGWRHARELTDALDTHTFD
jgi:hypothetical protein